MYFEGVTSAGRYHLLIKILISTNQSITILRFFGEVKLKAEAVIILELAKDSKISFLLGLGHNISASFSMHFPNVDMRLTYLFGFLIFRSLSLESLFDGKFDLVGFGRLKPLIISSIFSILL